VQRFASYLLIATLAFGAFAFGAVYPWAYTALSVGIVTFSVAVLFVRSPRIDAARVALLCALAAVAGAIALQLIPVPLDRLSVWSPSTVRALERLDPQSAAHLVDRHALSIDPQRTILGLTLFLVNALFVFSSARLFSSIGVRRFAEALTALAVLLALTGIVQQPLTTEKIYGLWTPIDGGSPYGPFVNKNHFAGWMLMALPLTFGLICGRVARGLAGVRPTWRDRILWLSSPDASRLILLAGAAVVMALALVLTMSRSGISAFALALAVSGFVVIRRQRGSRRTASLAYFTFLAVLVLGWVGVDVLAMRFSQADWDEINGRRTAWSDAMKIATDFPSAGSGLNTYAVATLLYPQKDVVRHYTEAHNDYLQLAAEGGALVVAPAALAVVCFGVIVWRRFSAETSTTTYWLRVGAVTGLIAIAFQDTVEFSLQMPGNAALFATLCGAAIHRTPERKVSASWQPARGAVRTG
jgi:O-antigen ligase